MTIMTELTPNRMTLRMSEDAVTTGNEIVVTAIEGLDSANMRRDSTRRLLGDGDFTEQGSRGGKVISIAGDAVFDTRREAKLFVIDLLSFLADGGVGELVVIDDDLELTRTTYVELNNLDEPVIDGTSVSFAYDLYAADPAKYGEDVVIPAPTQEVPGDPATYEQMPNNRVRVFNRSSIDGYLIMYSSSEGGSPVVTEIDTGTVMSVPGMVLYGGDTAVYNSRDKTVVVYTAVGDANYFTIPDSSFFMIPAGESRVYEVTNNQAAIDSGANDVIMNFGILDTYPFQDQYTATFNKVNGNPMRDVIASYGPNKIMTIQAVAHNDGNATVFPSFEIVGSYPDGVAIIDNMTGRMVGVSGPVDAYEWDPLVIDCRKHTARTQYEDFSQRLTYRQWHRIEGRSDGFFQTTYNSVGPDMQKMNVRFKPKWH